MTMITTDILCVVINQCTPGTLAIVATELCLVMRTSRMVTTTAVCLHLQMDRTNANIPISELVDQENLIQNVTMVS